MAVAMEVAWRGAELGSSSVPVLDLGKKRAWGADTEKLMQLMMGQFGGNSSSSPSSLKPAEVTLDLLGTGISSSSCRGAGTELDCNSSPPEFLELDPDQPLPSGWEKCLDLKTGELYFVNKSSGVRTSEDPRKQLQQQRPPIVSSEHEFLASKRSETESLQRASTSSASSGGSPPPQPQQQRLSFSTGKQLWSLQLDDRSIVSLNKTAPPPSSFPNSEEDSDLELNLNLSTNTGSPSRHQSVCTMEMVEKALKRTEKAMGKREMLGPKGSGSSSFSSLTSSRSEPSWSQSSPSTSSSSSTSSRSAAHNVSAAADLQSSTPGVCEAESRKAEAATPADALVMGACTRCLTYVMLHKSDPKCPRCESEVPLNSFISPPSSKRQRVETTTIQT